MIDRYTIKFGPAVSQKELEKALNDPGHNEGEVSKRIDKMKARLDIVGNFEDIKAIGTFIKTLERSRGNE